MAQLLNSDAKIYDLFVSGSGGTIQTISTFSTVTVQGGKLILSNAVMATNGYGGAPGEFLKVDVSGFPTWGAPPVPVETKLTVTGGSFDAGNFTFAGGGNVSVTEPVPYTIKIADSLTPLYTSVTLSNDGNYPNFIQFSNTVNSNAAVYLNGAPFNFDILNGNEATFTCDNQHVLNELYVFGGADISLAGDSGSASQVLGKSAGNTLSWLTKPGQKYQTLTLNPASAPGGGAGFTLATTNAYVVPADLSGIKVNLDVAWNFFINIAAGGSWDTSLQFQTTYTINGGSPVAVGTAGTYLNVDNADLPLLSIRTYGQIPTALATGDSIVFQLILLAVDSGFPHTLYAVDNYTGFQTPYVDVVLTPNT